MKGKKLVFLFQWSSNYNIYELSFFSSGHLKENMYLIKNIYIVICADKFNYGGHLNSKCPQAFLNHINSHTHTHTHSQIKHVSKLTHTLTHEHKFKGLPPREKFT